MRAVSSLETVAADAYTRVIWADDLADADVSGPVRLTLRHRGDPSRFAVQSVPALPPAALRRLVTRMFDLDADMAAFAAHVRRDRVLGPLVAAHPPGLRLPQLLDPFEALIRAILGQQVSVAAATTMADRLVRLVAMPGPLHDDPDASTAPRYAFPRAAAIVEQGVAGLRTIGLTRAKAASVHGVATAVATGAIRLAALRGAPAEEVDRALVALPGVGPWTAAYVRMRALGDRDAFPAADLGVIKALAARGVPRARIEHAAERWRPWRGYATLHLWHALSVTSA